MTACIWLVYMHVTCTMYSYDDPVTHDDIKFTAFHPGKQTGCCISLMKSMLCSWVCCMPEGHVASTLITCSLDNCFVGTSREQMQKWGESWTHYYISHRQYPTQAQCPAWNVRVIYKLNKYFMQIFLCTISFKAGRASKWTQILCYCKKLFFLIHTYILYMIKRLYNISLYTYQCDYFWLETLYQAREYPNLYRGSSLPVALVMSPAPKATRTDARNMQHLVWLVDTTLGLHSKWTKVWFFKQRSWNQTLVTQSWSWSNCCHWWVFS